MYDFEKELEEDIDVEYEEDIELEVMEWKGVMSNGSYFVW